MLSIKFSIHALKCVFNRHAFNLLCMLHPIPVVCNIQKGNVRLELRSGRITASAISSVVRMLGHCTSNISTPGFRQILASAAMIRDRRPHSREDFTSAKSFSRFASPSHDSLIPFLV